VTLSPLQQAFNFVPKSSSPHGFTNDGSLMKSITKQIDTLLEVDRSRDLLVHLGPNEPASIPPGLLSTCVESLADNFSFRLFAGSDAPLSGTTSPDGSLMVWLWGSVSHPDISEQSLPKWLIATYNSTKAEQYSDLQGVFVIFLLDKRSGTLHLFTDPLSLRPVYLRKNGHDVWISSRVGTAWDSAVLPASINKEALRSWAVFGFNATDGALLDGWIRPNKAAWLQIGRQGIATDRYFDFPSKYSAADPRETTDRLFALVEKSFDTQCESRTALKLSLSGGFDSRLLAAFASRRSDLPLRVMAVNGSHNYRDRLTSESTETHIARQVCERLGLPLDVIDLEHDALAGFVQPFVLMADGFPITRQMIDLVARSGSPEPVVNGFIGDSVMRGSWDKIDGRTEEEFEASSIAGLLLDRHSQLPTYLLKPKRAAELTEWAISFIDNLMQPFRQTNQTFVGIDLWMRQRFYMSNNFLQHLDRCEPILPYSTAQLIALKLSIPNALLSFDSFREGLGRHFPEIADIPHTKDIARPAPTFRPSSYTKRRWAIQALATLPNRRNLGLFDRRKLLSRLTLGAMDGRFEFVAEVAMRFLMLEALADQLGFSLDWEG
jgi:hypothetical protein